jgi:hypothetical protein
MRPERDQSPLAFGMEEAFGDQLSLLVVSEVKCMNNGCSRACAQKTGQRKRPEGFK